MDEVNNNVMNNRQKHPTCPSETVKVIVRCRPLSEKESSSGHQSIVKVHRRKGEIEVDRPFNSVCNTNTCERKSFLFDAVYDSRVSQTELYEEAFKPLVNSVLEGFNGTVFAYGQTGTGKTYTMEGARDSVELQGVIPQAFKHIFDHISKSPEKRYLVRASYLEIYQEEVKDLLSNSRTKKCALREQFKNGVSIKGLSSYFCSSINEINEVMTRGNKNRSVGATNMNEHSSRSHAIFTITIEVCETWSDGQEHIKMGKLNLVDLAGSERQGKAGTSGERLREATKINLSLSALGNVISSLVDGSSHIPYRDSKLTRLLQDSLGGNSRTVMVATIGPANYNCDETLNTLRYACRAKKITNKPRINEDPKDAILREYQDEINRLKNLLSLKQKTQSQDHVSISESQSSCAASTEKGSEEDRDVEKDLFLEKIRMAEQKRVSDLIPLLKPYGLDPSHPPQQIMEELEKTRDKLIKDDGIVQEEKTRILKELDETTSHIKKTEEECAHLIEKINWLESKLLNSGKSLLEHTEEQEKLLQVQRAALKEQEEKEKILREELKAKELSTLELEDSLAQYKVKVERKTAKLKKLKKLIKRAGSQQFKILNEHESHILETEKMLRNITMEYKMKKKMVDNFVPQKERKRLESRIRYNSEQDNYFVLKDELKPMKRPSFTRKDNYRVYTQNGAKLSPMKEVYYSNENILQLAMEIPEWQKKTFVPEKVDPRIKSMVTAALEDAKETLKLDCQKLKTTSPKPPKPHLFYSCGQEELLRQINLPKTKSQRSSIPPNPLIKYEDFAIAENCIGEKSNTQCRVKILDESFGKIKGRRPNRSDLYAMPLFAGQSSAFTHDTVVPEEESLDELIDDEFNEQGIDELMESLKDIEQLNKMGRQSKHALSLDNIPIQHTQTTIGKSRIRGKHGAGPKASASTGSIPKNNKSECDPNDEVCGKESHMSPSCTPDENGVMPDRCSPLKGHRGRDTRDPPYHHLRPSSATLAFELEQRECLENPSACKAPNIRPNLLNPPEIKILAKPSNQMHCSVSSGKLYSRRICQVANDSRRAVPRYLNKKRDDTEMTPPMAMEVYEKVRHSSKNKSRNCLDGDTSKDNSSGYSCGGSDIDEYMQNLCNGPRGLYKFNP